MENHAIPDPSKLRDPPDYDPKTADMASLDATAQKFHKYTFWNFSGRYTIPSLFVRKDSPQLHLYPSRGFLFNLISTSSNQL